MKTDHTTDIAIIGAGPVGLFAIFEAGMLELNCHIIDNLEEIGGQCEALYKEKPIYDIPAHPKITAGDLVENLYKQAKPFNPTYHLNQQVTELDKDDSYYYLTTSKGVVIAAKAVVIAAGCGAFKPKKPPIAGIEEFENKSVFYNVSDIERFRGKHIAIAGGGDSAADWAIHLGNDIAEKIYLIHRRSKFRCAPESLRQIKELEEKGKVEMVVPYQLYDIRGNDGWVSEILVRDLDDNYKSLDASMFLAFYGLSMKLGPIAEWGLNLTKNHIDVDKYNYQTNRELIYAIGDIANYPQKIKLILTGFSEAATVMHDMYPKITGKALHFEYSTNTGVPGEGK
jgi:thioredoxin reductase (NADPH)